MANEPEPELRLVVRAHTVCTGPDGAVKWEADTEPVYLRLSPCGAGTADDPLVLTVKGPIEERPA